MSKSLHKRGGGSSVIMLNHGILSRMAAVYHKSYLVPFREPTVGGWEIMESELDCHIFPAVLEI